MPEQDETTPPLDPRLIAWMHDRNRFAEQNEDGVDLSLIRENLKLTATQRVQQNYDYAQGVVELQASVRRIK